MKTQEQKILEHLQYRGPLTPIEALNLYGCLRLAAVIHSLKSKNHDIFCYMVQKNKKHFAQYSLAGGAKPRPSANETLDKMKQWEQDRINQKEII